MGSFPETYNDIPINPLHLVIDRFAWTVLIKSEILVTGMALSASPTNGTELVGDASS